MIWLVIACALGIPAGFVLLWKVPTCGDDVGSAQPEVSVIIPARNEERNLPRLLKSIAQSESQSREIVLVDDESIDATSAVARSFDARVVSSTTLPDGWTGKTWACVQGAAAARSDLLLFVDADTWFESRGLERLAARYQSLANEGAALSVLPYHVLRAPYEELSMFFNLLMAFGAGGFGGLGRAKLFGQSLLISRKMYALSGGHAEVRRAILENVAMSSNIQRVGGKCVGLGGRGTLHIRMFPDGISQLCEGWTKAFADGAAASDQRVLAVAIVWLTALCATFSLLLFGPATVKEIAAGLYACFVVQLIRQARQIGNYRFVTCLFYPVPLLFFFFIFGQSLSRRVLKRRVTWRGRSL
jgi:4,4'-diaponeurosporenoate glycosyltransferase